MSIPEGGVIAVHGLTVCYPDGFQALKEVTADFPVGRITAVMGPNGAGKSTLFRCMLGLLKPDAGVVLLDGQDAARMTPKALAARVAYVPQQGSADPDGSVLDNVLLGTMRGLSIFGVPGKAQRAAALDAIARLGLTEKQDRPFRSLSGGERGLTWIARALAQRARILVMDEPDAALDYGNRIRLMDAVRGLKGYTVIFSTHDPQTAMDYADQLLALKNGGVAAFGPASALPDTALLRELYQVPARVALLDGKRLVIAEKEDLRAAFSNGPLG